MSDWTNLEEILQDLSVAQRCEVPAPLETFNSVGPPAFNVKEEESAEQSYYASQGGGGDLAAPDFELIQEMLNMVKEKKDGQGDTLANSSDLDPYRRDFVPKQIRKKIKRNVALTSIITAKEAELSARRPIPKDVIPVMFKKKSLNHTPHHNTEENSRTGSASQTSSPEKCKQYTPSTHASEYYTKYLQKSKLREELEEDIWTKAERQMKELEVRKKRKAQIVSPKESGSTSPSGVERAFLNVHLPEHRHLMPGDCIVCIVAAKHGYYF